MPVPVLEVSDVVKDYGSLRAVDHVSLKVDRGEILGLLGPNGAGKTSLINTIVTLEKLSRGRIAICGYDLKKAPRICKSLTGYMPQEVIHHGYFNLEEVIGYHSGFYGCVSNKPYLESLMKKFSLWEYRKKKVRELSGGMKRRLLLAKSLVHDPVLVLLDEPSTGVDVHLRYDTWEFVRNLRNEGKAVLFTTHYLEEAEKLCDRVAIIHKGKIIRENKTKNLIREFTSRKLMIWFKQPVGNIQHKYLKAQRALRLEFHIPSSMDIGDLFQELPFSWRDVSDIQIQEGTLEDVFKDVLDKNEK